MATKTARRILVVDDEPEIRQIIEHLLLSEGYVVTCAADGMQALALVHENPPDLVLLDLDMPCMGGLAVCRSIKSERRFRFLPVLILTARDPLEARLAAWDLGADDFLTKPFRIMDIAARCRSLLRMKGFIDELDSAQSVIFSLARAIEAKSIYTKGHTDRVTHHALALGRQCRLSESDLQVLECGAALHDIGKIAVPDALLDKPGRLTHEEFEIIKQHPLEGVRIVEPLSSIRDAIPLIRWHHERMDGKGYPDGLFGGAIPLLTRILAVADVYDALASERPYRKAWPLANCLEEMERNAAEGGLDPELVSQFSAYLQTGKQEVLSCQA